MKRKILNTIKKSALCFGVACGIAAVLFAIMCVGIMVYWPDTFEKAAPQDNPPPEAEDHWDNDWYGGDFLFVLLVMNVLPLLAPIWAGIVLLACLAVNFYYSSSPPSPRAGSIIQRMRLALTKTVLCLAITAAGTTLLSIILTGFGWFEWPAVDDLNDFLFMLLYHGYRVITQIWAGVAMLVFLVAGFYQSSSEEPA